MYTSNGEGRFEVLVDDVLRETVTLPTTHTSADPVDWRQWHHWNKLVDDRPIDLLAGLHTLRIRFLAGNTNLDYIEFRPR